MKYSTTKIRPFEVTTPEPEVAVGIFDSRGIAWKDSSLSWLDKMREQRFGLIEGHTLELLSNCHCENFILLVVAQSLARPEPLPPKIYFAHWELDEWSGHDIYVDCNESPPITSINRHFWGQREGQGETPFFERYVQPIIDELVSNFQGGDSWAS